MRIPVSTKRPRFYVATGLYEAFSSFGTIRAARACLERFKTEAPGDYQHIRGIIETGPNSTDVRSHIFHAKGLKPIKRIPGGMVDGGNAYIITAYDQGFHFHLVSKRIWVDTQNTLNHISYVIDTLFPAQEDDIADEPEVLEHVRVFHSLKPLLDYVEKHRMQIINTFEERSYP
jgi:hypothetical protein